MATQAWTMAPDSNTFVILHSLFDIRYSSAYPFSFLALLRQEITINARAVRVDGYGDGAGLGRVEDFCADALVGFFDRGRVPASAAAYYDPAGCAPGGQPGRIAAAAAVVRG